MGRDAHPPRQAQVFVALGSNLDDPVAQVRSAFQDLDAIPASRCVRRSSLYRSVPIGPAGQPDYINAVAALETGLAPEELLDHLQAIERRHGRVRGAERWGPRTLDLDLLLYDDRVMQTERLTIPHPGLHLRAFVLYPLHEIAPGLRIPQRGSLDELIKQCPMEGLVRLGEES